MAKLKKTILRERMLEQLGHENVTVFKGLKEALPGVPDDVIQSMTATVMIACDKGTVYTPGDFDIADYEAPKPKTEAKAEAPIGNGKTEEQIAQDVKERGGDQASPEQKAELERLAKMHNTAPVDHPNEKGKELEKAAADAIEPYDEVAKKWRCCPACKSEDINHVSGDKREWQGCNKDKIFLNADGTVKPYKRDANAQPGQKRIDGKAN